MGWRLASGEDGLPVIESRTAETRPDIEQLTLRRWERRTGGSSESKELGMEESPEDQSSRPVVIPASGRFCFI
jgi:hypothetical protein